MFVQDFIEVEQPLEATLECFVDLDWWVSIAGVSSVRLGDPRARGDAVLVPFSARIEERRSSLPLNGDFELSPLGAARTHIMVSGSYPRPDEGRTADTVVAREVAGTVRSLLDGLGAALTGGGR